MNPKLINSVILDIKTVAVGRRGGGLNSAYGTYISRSWHDDPPRVDVSKFSLLIVPAMTYHFTEFLSAGPASGLVVYITNVQAHYDPAL